MTLITNALLIYLALVITHTILQLTSTFFDYLVDRLDLTNNIAYLLRGTHIRVSEDDNPPTYLELLKIRYSDENSVTYGFFFHPTYFPLSVTDISMSTSKLIYTLAVRLENKLLGL